MIDYEKYWEMPLDKISDEMKRQAIKALVVRVLDASDWTQLPDSGLTLQQQLDQQAVRAEWMALDDPAVDPDTVVLPPYPMTERP